MSHKFVSGDRVNIYTNTGKLTGFVNSTFDSDDYILCKVEQNGVVESYHCKQLRKIKPNTRVIRITKDILECAFGDAVIMQKSTGKTFYECLRDELFHA